MSSKKVVDLFPLAKDENYLDLSLESIVHARCVIQSSVDTLNRIVSELRVENHPILNNTREHFLPIADFINALQDLIFEHLDEIEDGDRSAWVLLL